MSFFTKIIFIGSVLALGACNNNLSDYVKGVEQAPSQGDSNTNTSTNKALKLSPGHVLASGQQVKAALTLTPTQQSFSGTKLKARVSLSQTQQNR